MKKFDVILVGADNEAQTKAVLYTLAGAGLYAEGDGFKSVPIDGLLETFLTGRNAASFTLIVGGLGFAPEDRTAELIAAALGLPLEYDRELAAHIDARLTFLDPRKADTYPCAKLPRGSVVLEAEGTPVPGCVIELPENTVILLPGEPDALSALVTGQLIPYLENIAGGKTVRRKLMLFGLSEEAVREKLAEFTGKLNPTLVLESKGLLHNLSIYMTAADSKTAEQMVQETLSALFDRFGTAAMGVDCNGLEEVVVNLLLYNKLRIAAAESCTGGLLSSHLVNVPGASGVFDLGVTAYAGDKKVNVLHVPIETLQHFGEVSAETAVAMANGVRELSYADLGVGITGIAGPDGGTPEKPVGLVYIAIADRKHALVRRLNLGETQSRETIRDLSTLYALDFIRKYLMSYPVPLPGSIELSVLDQNVRSAVMNSISPQPQQRPVPPAGAPAAAPQPVRQSAGPGGYAMNPGFPPGTPVIPAYAQEQNIIIERIVNERRRP